MTFAMAQPLRAVKGGCFELEVVFTEDYNEAPPFVRFMGIPFHPNVDMESGEVSLDILRECWNPQIALGEMFQAIRVNHS